MSRRVVVTGAAGGIGSAAAAAFAAEGWEVTGLDIADARADWRGDLRRLDLGADEAERELEVLFASLTDVEAVVHAAGIQNTGSAVDTTDAEWSRIMNVNARGALWLSRAALSALRGSRRGSIVFVASVHAMATTRGAAAYAASKAALLSLTRSLALEWAPEVRVNCVLPGAIDTPMLAEGLTRDPDGTGRGGLESTIPLRRIGLPAEVAPAIVFLADSHRSAFITGQSLVVDGGVLAGLGTP